MGDGAGNLTGGVSVPPMLGLYQVLDKVGQGGMAIVYRGVQPSLNRPVAIKVLPPQFASTPELLGRFEREAAIVSQLNHSNIVQVIDRGKQDNLLYIVMEFVDGESLDKIIRASPLSVETLIDYAMQICEGLDYAHGAGVVHRDLKPSNILVEKRSGRVKIADFGIAQLETTSGVLATMTNENTAIGTMNYMSPEQRLDAHRVTHLTDIFSFGVIFYEMVTGKLPIGHFKLPSLLRSDIPLGFDTIVKKCLAESAADRYQSAGEIRQELGQLTGHGPKSRKMKSSISRLGRLSKRQRVFAIGGMAAAAGLLLAALAGVAVVRGSRRPAAPVRATREATALIDAKVEALFARAQGLISQGKFEDGIQSLRELVEDYPRHALAPEAQFALASALYASGDKEKCKLEFDRLIKNYPDASRVPEAIVARCRAEWETAPYRKRMLFFKEWDAALQERLVQGLQDLLRKQPKGAHVAGALALIAEIAEPPSWANDALAADALLQLDTLKPGENAYRLYHGAELYDQKLGQAEKAVQVYQRFVDEFPQDTRVPRARDRMSELREKLQDRSPGP